VNLNQTSIGSGNPREEEFPNTGRRLKIFGALTAAVTLAFASPIKEWVQLGLRSELHSCTLIVPFLCVFLGWRSRNALPAKCSSAPALGAMLIAAGLVALASVRWIEPKQIPDSTEALFLRITALVCFINGLAFQVLGMQVMRTLAFPAAFLIFMIPLPLVAVNGLEIFFQHTSAVAASWLFKLSGTTVYCDGLHFKLPGMVELVVAQECSGIRSSYALFLTSLLAGHLLLRSMTNRLLLAVFVVPLGIVRNAFRVVTLGLLASKYDRGVLDSPLHHQGGPVFFALSLLPFFAVVLWMNRRERKLRTGAKAGLQSNSSQ
jgi:exosortase C (VPDSG-CTERM-specific)